MTREQLEEQAETNRAAVAGTLDELKKRLSPGEIVDEVLAYMQGGGNDFINNLGKQVTDNPMPVTLIGAGLAWFMFGKNAVNANVPAPRTYPGNGSPYPHTDSYSGSAFGTSYPTSGSNAGSYARSAASDMGDAANSAMNRAGEMASSAADGVSDAASNAYQQAAGAASSAYHQATDAASSVYSQAADQLAMARVSAIQVEQKAMAVAENAVNFVQQQPLILAGIGLALGAAIGAALPSTELEDKLLGETSDEMKGTAKTAAVDQLDKAKAVGQKVGDALKEEAEKAAGDLAAQADDMDIEDRDSNAMSSTGRPSWSDANRIPH